MSATYFNGMGRFQLHPPGFFRPWHGINPTLEFNDFSLQPPQPGLLEPLLIFPIDYGRQPAFKVQPPAFGEGDLFHPAPHPLKATMADRD